MTRLPLVLWAVGWPFTTHAQVPEGVVVVLWLLGVTYLIASAEGEK